MLTGLKITNGMDPTLYNSTLFAAIENNDDNNNNNDDNNNKENKDKQNQIKQPLVHDKMDLDEMQGPKRPSEQSSINKDDRVNEEAEIENDNNNVEL
jgi:hypothetical protein